MQAMEVDIDRVVVAVYELNELLGTALLLHRYQSIETPDTMVGMYNEVSTIEAL